MKQTIEAPGEEDIDQIARRIFAARDLVERAYGSQDSFGSLRDLDLIKGLLDRGIVGLEDTFDLQALGLMFGQVIVKQVEDMDWCMVEDELGRTPALRYKETSLIVFPMTMISKRVEKAEEIDLHEIFDFLVKKIEDARLEVLQH